MRRLYLYDIHRLNTYFIFFRGYYMASKTKFKSLSDFVHNATLEEKEAFYKAVIDKAITSQKAVVQAAQNK